MPNSLTAAGTTRLSWSLSNSDSAASQSAGTEQRTARAVTNGTGPGQANVAHSQRIICTGSGSSLSIGGLEIQAFGVTGILAIGTLKELLVNVVSGPTGGFLSLAAPGGITGTRVGVGGQVHWADYAVGATGVSVSLSSGPTGTYTVDLTMVGVGVYAGNA
jgi:hypothetical protein